MTPIIILTILAFIINLPFGYLRKKSKKYSFKWFLCIHMPVPVIVLVRILFHIDFRFIPLFILAAISGQYLGGGLFKG
jgi:hypothetical protein